MVVATRVTRLLRLSKTIIRSSRSRIVAAWVVAVAVVVVAGAVNHPHTTKPHAHLHITSRTSSHAAEGRRDNTTITKKRRSKRKMSTS